MDQKKIGEYIKTLRENEDLTQDQLARELAITRQAISKWETGVNMPDTETLKKMSLLFNVSIEKLIDGGETQEKISVSKNYKELTSKAIDDNIMLKQTIKRRTKTMIIISTIALIVLLILFLTYYFANSYGKTHIYKIYGSSDNYEITSGIFIRNTERSYFNLGTITVKNEVEPDIKELYYIKDDKERLIIKGSVDSILQEDYGYDEYFSVDDMNIILDNLYVRFYKDNKVIDNFKLVLQEDYVNNKLFFRKTEKISDEDQPTVEIENPERDELIEKIKNKFEYKEEDDSYYYTVKENKMRKTFWLSPSNNDIGLMIDDQKGKDLELYIYSYDSSISYFEYSKNFSWLYTKDGFQCSYGECKFSKEKIDYFLNKLEEILQ